MKKIILSLNRKDLFTLLLAPIAFISTFFLTGIIGNIIINSLGEPKEALSFNRFLFIVLTILMIFFSLKVFQVLNKIFLNSNKSYCWTLFLSLLAIFYVCSFQAKPRQEIFFIELFIPSLVINIIITYIISFLLLKFLKKKKEV